MKPKGYLISVFQPYPGPATLLRLPVQRNSSELLKQVLVEPRYRFCILYFYIYDLCVDRPLILFHIVRLPLDDEGHPVFVPLLVHNLGGND